MLEPSMAYMTSSVHRPSGSSHTVRSASTSTWPWFCNVSWMTVPFLSLSRGSSQAHRSRFRYRYRASTSSVVAREPGPTRGTGWQLVNVATVRIATMNGIERIGSASGAKVAEMGVPFTIRRLGR